ncbi:MAG: TraB/GumN family protein [Symploca sp. SIO2D2]|nr:TraB/GumN family protein [Symploca sp. SIO2D2]
MTIRFLSSLLAICLTVPFLSADACVWRLEKDGNAIYLGGTIHLLPQNGEAIPEEYQLAFEAAQVIAFETDIGKLSEPETQYKMMAEALYQDERRLSKLLEPETLQSLATALQQNGIPFNDQLTASWAILSLSLTDLIRLGYSAEGVDPIFYAKAKEAGKEIVALETVDEQIEVITSMGSGYEQSFVAITLEDRKNLQSDFEALLDAWSHGDIETFWNQTFMESMRKLPELNKRLIIDRNLNWLPKIEQLIDSGVSAFILVGAGHFPGEDGLLQLLEARGYEIEKFVPQVQSL